MSTENKERSPEVSRPGEQATLITHDPLLTQGFPYASSPEFFASLLNKKGPWTPLLKWLGPALCMSLVFLVWAGFNHIRQQRSFDRVSEVNGKLLEISEHLAFGRLEDASQGVEKLIHMLPGNDRLEELHSEIQSKLKQARAPRAPEPPDSKPRPRTSFSKPKQGSKKSSR